MEQTQENSSPKNNEEKMRRKREEVQKQITLMDVLRQEQNQDTMNKLLLTTVIMFTLPFLCFYGVVGFATDIWPNLQDRQKWGGIVAVISVLCIMAGYVIVAFTEDVTDPAAKILKKKQ